MGVLGQNLAAGTTQRCPVKEQETKEEMHLGQGAEYPLSTIPFWPQNAVCQAGAVSTSSAAGSDEPDASLERPRNQGSPAGRRKGPRPGHGPVPVSRGCPPQIGRPIPLSATDGGVNERIARCHQALRTNPACCCSGEQNALFASGKMAIKPMLVDNNNYRWREIILTASKRYIEQRLTAFHEREELI
jgi:hypothetical protein